MAELSSLASVIKTALSGLAGGERLHISAIDGAASAEDVTAATESAANAAALASDAAASAEAAASSVSPAGIVTAFADDAEANPETRSKFDSGAVAAPVGYRNLYVKRDADLQEGVPYRFVLNTLTEDGAYFDAQVSTGGARDPIMTTAPVMTGTGVIGTTMTVSDGEWLDADMETIERQWMRGEFEIEGATGSSYTPTNDDDGQDIAVRISVSNDSGAVMSHVTNSVEAEFPVPTITRTIPPLTYSASPGVVRTYNLAGVFSHPVTVTATGSSRVSVAEDNGSIAINVGSALGATTITLTGTNSGGSVTTTFSLTVSAAAVPDFVSVGGGNGTSHVYTDYQKDNITIAFAKRTSDNTAITMPNLTQFTDNGKWVSLYAGVDGRGTGGYQAVAYRRCMSDGNDGDLGTWTNALGVTYITMRDPDWTLPDPIGAAVFNWEQGRTWAKYMPYTLENANSAMVEYAAIESGITGQAPTAPTGQTMRAQNTGGGLRFQVSSTGAPPATSRAAFESAPHTVQSGNSGTQFSASIEVLGPAAAAVEEAPPSIAAASWSVREITDPAEADSLGFSGRNGRLEYSFNAGLVTSVTNGSGTYNLVLTPKGGAPGPNAIAVTPGLTYRTVSDAAVGASITPAVYWRRGSADTGQYFEAGTKAAITIAGLDEDAPIPNPPAGDNSSGSYGGKVVNVSTTSALVTAIKNAEPGTEIHIAPGNYGNVTATKIKKGTASWAQVKTWVRIRAKDRNNPPVMGSIDMSGCSGFIVESLIIRPSGRDTQNAKIPSDEFPNGEYVGTGTGLTMTLGSYLWVHDIRFEFCRKVFQCNSSNNILFEYNESRYLAMDFATFFGTVSNIRVRHNLCHMQLTPWDGRSSADTEHPDLLFQVASRPNGAAKDCEVEGNYVEQKQVRTGGGRVYSQICWCGTKEVREGKSVDTFGHRDMVFRNNFIMANHPHGIGIEGAVNWVVERNKFCFPPGTTDARKSGNIPNVSLNGKNFRNVVIRNNVAPKGSPNFLGGASANTSGLSISGYVAADNLTTMPSGWVPVVKEGANRTVGPRAPVRRANWPNPAP